MEIKQGEKLKWGYGVAWRNYNRISHMAYPVPFNILFRWARELWIYLSTTRGDYSTDFRYNEAYEHGFLTACRRKDMEIKTLRDSIEQTNAILFEMKELMDRAKKKK